MIKIDKIHIAKFRGILDLRLEFGGRNYAVCGPNGTGKSGVVDAIEFALSGGISRLSGKDRGDVSVKQHAPHVDFRDKPEEAVVTLEGVLAGTGTKFKVSRTVAQSQKPTIEPNTPEVVEAINEFGRHKNVTLSRRELIQFVLSTPGNRASEIQALLQLNALRDLRQNFQKIYKALEKDSNATRNNQTNAATALATALDIPKLSPVEVLRAVNERRKVLALPGIPALEAKTSVKDGLTVASAGQATAVSKVVAVADVKKLKSGLETYVKVPQGDLVADCLQRLAKLAESKDFEQGVEKKDLLDRAIKLVEDGVCPVCDTKWPHQDLIERINRKLKALEAVTEEKQAILTALDPIVAELSALEASARTAASYGPKLATKIDPSEINEFADSLNAHTKILTDFPSLAAVIDTLQELRALPSGLNDRVNELATAVGVLPNTADRDAARDYLVAVEERLDAFREAKRRLQSAEQDTSVARIVFETYDKTYNDGLNAIYTEIQDGFADLYRRVNQEDEGEFEALLAAERAGLGLDVDFYGRGKFPPGAYHSEGHQDGMGLCLYLALMKHLYGEQFQFCVLDDVLMSVDSGHRRAVCKVLSESFPDTQFVFTTHDEVWLKNMQSTGLVKPKDHILFRNWTVESGPSEWIATDIWQEIEDDIAKNDVRSAAARLRHYLEFIAGQLCHNLRASVVYRGDNRHMLGDLMPQATSRFSKLLKDARVAAQSWKNEDEVTRLSELEASFKAAVAASLLEQWALNAKVHYNEWANLAKEDFAPVAASFRDLLAYFQCDRCSGLLYVVPNQGEKQALRCRCGSVNLNFNKG